MLAMSSKGQTTCASDRSAAIERCHRELAAIEAEIRAGNPDLQGLCLALSDWSTELRILEALPWKIKFFGS
jgi:hypothetical protein